MTPAYDIKDGVTQSILQMFSQCRQRAEFYLDGWRPITTGSSRALYFGSMFHDVLDQCAQNMNLPPLTVLASWRIGHEMEIVKKEFDQNRVDEIMFEIDKLQTLFQCYVDFYPKAFDPETHIESEIVFDVPYGPIRLRGKIDRLYKVGDRYWLEETKTKSRIDDMGIEAQLQFDFQSLYYAKAIGIKMKIDIEGVCYNVVRNPQLRLKKDETTANYCVRLRKDITSRPEFYFKRFNCAFSAPSKVRFDRNLNNKLHAFGTWIDDPERETYRNESSCLYPYKCQFIDACSSGDMLNYEKTGVLFEELDDGETIKDIIKGGCSSEAGSA